MKYEWQIKKYKKPVGHFKVTQLHQCPDDTWRAVLIGSYFEASENYPDELSCIKLIQYSKDPEGKTLHKLTGPAVLRYVRSFGAKRFKRQDCENNMYWVNGRNFNSQEFREFIIKYPTPEAADLACNFDALF